MSPQDAPGREDPHRSALARRAERRRDAAHARRLGEAADAGPTMIWVTDARGAVAYVNRRWMEFVGYAPPAGGEGLASTVHPDDRPGLVESLARAVQERSPFEREYRVLRHDGVWRWVLDSAEPRFDADGRYLGHAGAAVDVTDQREALEALKLSDTRFRRFAEASDDFYWMADAAVARLIFANSALERVWGASRDALFNDFDAYWPRLIHPEDLPRVTAALDQLRKGFARTLNYRVIRPRDGAERIAEDRAFPIHDEGGVRLVGGILRDVTETVRSQEHLERRVAERTAELEVSNQRRHDAEAALAQTQRLETLGRLTGGLAHDFNNLLTVMIGGLDMILRRPDQLDRVRRLGAAALEAGRRGQRLTQQLLGFSRRRALRIETVSVGDLIREFEPMLRGALGEATPLTLRLEPGLNARLDRSELEAALLNLVVNARDALEPGGSVTISAGCVRLADGDLPDAHAGDFVRIEVIDTGQGMAPDVAARAFEPFFTTRRDRGGSGLGLAQVFGFVRQSGGGARIKSAPGRGTTVCLFVPFSSAPLAAVPRGAEPERSLEGLQVLLVDDDAAVRTTTRGLLQELELEVLTAADGPSALSVLERHPDVGLLLTDVVMPGMNGADLARAAQALRPELRVLLSTGYASDSVAEVEDWSVLRKPYRVADLDRAIQRAMA